MSAPGLKRSAIERPVTDTWYTILIVAAPLITAVVLHEWAHARVAVSQGDPTPARLGRVTLNPVAHIDLIGTILVPAVLLASGSGFLFGWARPVPVQPANFRDPRRGDILVSLAGVTANLLLVPVWILVAVATAWTLGGESGLGLALTQMARIGILLNLILAVFNLIPIPPLDGSHVLYHFLPPDVGRRYRELGRYGMLLLFALLFLAPDVFSVLLWPVGVLEDLATRLIERLT